MPYETLLPGYQLMDDTDINVVAVQINSALAEAEMPPSLNLPILAVGYRMVDGAYFSAMATALTALGKAGFPIAYQAGYRLLDGSWLNAMEAAISGAAGAIQPPPSIPSNVVTYLGQPVTYGGDYVTYGS